MLTLVLREPRLDEAKILNDWRNDSESRLYNSPIEYEKTLRRLKEAGCDFADEGRSEYCWIVECECRPRGAVLVKNIDWRAGTGELGYVTATESRGKGIGSLAVRMLVEKIFSESSLIKLIAYTKIGNEKSSKILDRIGFRQGVAPDSTRFDPSEFLFYELTSASWSSGEGSAA